MILGDASQNGGRKILQIMLRARLEQPALVVCFGG
jgi:hypothetical protein